MTKSPFGPSSSWWRARAYQVVDECLIVPTDGCQWPDDFEEYSPLDVYYSNEGTAPHVDLMNLDPAIVSEVLAFVEQWGLLGTALRFDFLTSENDPGNPRYTWGGQDVYTSGVRSHWTGDEYFEHCFKRPPSEVPFGFKGLWENYGEWADPGPDLTGDRRRDAYQVTYHSGVAEHHQTFSDGARGFQRDLENLRRGVGDLGLQEDGWGWDVKANPHVKWVSGIPRMGFDYPSLLDACYLMAMLDTEKDALHRCPECGRFWRQTKATRRSRVYCPPDDEDRQYHDPQNGPPSRSCTRRALNRKTDQRRSWNRFLERESPELIAGLPSSNGRVRHPHDMRDEIPLEVQELARRWARRVLRKSSRSYDMWLEPFVGE